MSSFQSTVYGDFAAAYESTRLVDICEPKEGVQTGPFGSQLHQEDYVPVGTPIITVEHLGENRILHSDIPRVSEEDRERLSKYTLLKGDIVFSRVGSVDRRALVRDEEDGWLFSGRCLRVRPNQSMIDPGYLSYFFGLPTFKEYIRAIAVGATMPSLNTKILSDVSIYYPPLPEQRAIAHILGTLDDKIELNRRMNETLEAMARAIFKSWFVDFDPVHAKAEGRDTGLPKEIADLFPDSFEETELGEVPKGWHVVQLGDMLKLLKDGSHNPPKRIESGIRFIAGATNIKNFSIDFSSCTFISQEDYEKIHKKWAIEPNDVLLTIVGTVGNVALVHETDLPFSLQRSIAILRTIDEISSAYLYYLIKSDYFQSEVFMRLNPTAQPGIYLGELSKILVLKPPEIIAKNFGEITKQMILKMRNNLFETSYLQSIRDYLLPNLMSGKMRVV